MSNCPRGNSHLFGHIFGRLRLLSLPSPTLDCVHKKHKGPNIEGAEGLGVFTQPAIEGKREIVRAACHQVDFSGKLNGIIFVVYLVKYIVVSETFWLLACSSTI